MQWMLRIEVEILASMGGFFINFGGLMTITSRKGIALSDSLSLVNWMEDLKLLRWLRKFCNYSEP
jgi:hypothetical protein